MTLADIIQGNAAGGPEESAGPRCFPAYARVSTDDQERAGLPMPAQVREMQQ